MPDERKTPLPVKRRIELAEAVIELAAAEAAAIDLTRGSFDSAKRYNKLHGQIDIMLNELDWLRAIDDTLGQAPS